MYAVENQHTSVLSAPCLITLFTAIQKSVKLNKYTKEIMIITTHYLKRNSIMLSFFHLLTSYSYTLHIDTNTQDKQ